MLTIDHAGIESRKEGTKNCVRERRERKEWTKKYIKWAASKQVVTTESSAESRGQKES